MRDNQLIANRFEIQDLLGRGGMGDVYYVMEIFSEFLQIENTVHSCS
jgi:hypothetical protein